MDEFLADLKEITKGSWSEDDLASAERRYERTAAVMKRLGSSETADRTWRMACLNTPDHMKFIAREVTEDGSELKAHDSDGGLSGGQRQKLVFFCLAAALRYQLPTRISPSTPTAPSSSTRRSTIRTASSPRMRSPSSGRSASTWFWPRLANYCRRRRTISDPSW